MTSAHLHSDHRSPQFVVHRQATPAMPAAPALSTTSLNNLDLHTTARSPDDDGKETYKRPFQNRVQTFEQQLEHLTYLRGVITRERRDASWGDGWDNQPPYTYRLLQLERTLVRFDAAEMQLLRTVTKGLREKLARQEEKNYTLQMEMRRAVFEASGARTSTDIITERWDASPAPSVVREPRKPASPAGPPFLASLAGSSSSRSTNILNLLTAAILPATKDKDSSDPDRRERTFDEQLEHLAYLRLVITRECDEAVLSCSGKLPPYRLPELEQTLARIDSVEHNLLRTETRRLQEKLPISENIYEGLQFLRPGRVFEDKDGGDGMGNGARRSESRYNACGESPPASVRGERRVGGGGTADKRCDDPWCFPGHRSCLFR